MSEKIDRRVFTNTYVTGSGRQNYLNIDYLEDPLFTSFTFDIDLSAVHKYSQGRAASCHGLHRTYSPGLRRCQGPAGAGRPAGQGAPLRQRQHHQECQERGGAQYRRSPRSGSSPVCRYRGR